MKVLNFSVYHSITKIKLNPYLVHNKNALWFKILHAVKWKVIMPEAIELI